MNENDEELLERYLDGLLAAGEKSAFEKRVAAEPELRRQVELQRRIDGAIVKTLPAAPDAKAVLAAARSEKKKVIRWVAPVVALAAGLLVVLAAYLYFTSAEPPKKQKLAHLTFEKAYAQRQQSGFQPDWVCKDEAEFQLSYKKAVGQPLRVAKLEKGSEMLGLAYFDTLSPWTIAFLAKVDGKDVIVFADPSSYDDAESPVVKLSPGSPLHLHKRVIEKVVLYELSPFDAPRVLPSFEKP